MWWLSFFSAPISDNPDKAGGNILARDWRSRRPFKLGPMRPCAPATPEMRWQEPQPELGITLCKGLTCSKPNQSLPSAAV